MRHPQNLHAELGIEPRASRMLSGCDTTTPTAPCKQRPLLEVTKRFLGCLSWLGGACFFARVASWVCVVSLPFWSFLVMSGPLAVTGACWNLSWTWWEASPTPPPLHTTTPTAPMSALTKMYLWIFMKVSADEDVFMKAKVYLWRCQRWRRCIYECEGVFMKVSALTKMYLWRRRCVYEGITLTKMYLW